MSNEQLMAVCERVMNENKVMIVVSTILILLSKHNKSLENCLALPLAFGQFGSSRQTEVKSLQTNTLQPKNRKENYEKIY